MSDDDTQEIINLLANSQILNFSIFETLHEPENT